MATLQVVFQGGSNDGRVYYVATNDLKPSYFLNILLPEGTDNALLNTYYQNGIPQRYELYTLHRRLSGEARYRYQGQVNVQTARMGCKHI